jgi:hypothetical protein
MLMPAGVMDEMELSLFIMRLCGSMLPHNRKINNDAISPNVLT